MFAPQLCPYCSHRLLRHISSKGLYWRCGHCREEVSSLSTSLEAHFRHQQAMAHSTSALERSLLEVIS
jgi:ribosomal protein L37AE/L43A